MYFSDSSKHNISLDYFSDFAEYAQEIQRSTEEGLIITIFDWKNFIPVLFGIDKAVVREAQKQIQEVLSKEFGSLFQFTAHDGAIIAIFPKVSVDKHKTKIQKFYERCDSIGASIDKNPIYLRFWSGSSVVTDDIQHSLVEAMFALHEAKNNVSVDDIFFSERDRQIKSDLNEVKTSGYFFDAVRNGNLDFAYQPIVDAKTEEISHYEVLLRIKDESGKLISVGPYIPVAEKFGFINMVDRFVLDYAVSELKQYPNLHLAINISNQTVRNKSLIKRIKAIINDEDLAKRLCIEITETGSEHNLEVIAHFVDQLKELGCTVSIDDFGSGYTSFKQLKMLNVDILKIDGSFIKDIESNPDSLLFVELLAKFAQSCKLKTVAEFVENEAIAEKLKKIGIDYFQGYYYGKPSTKKLW